MGRVEGGLREPPEPPLDPSLHGLFMFHSIIIYQICLL